MEYTGILRKYPVDRPLTEQERERQLRQAERLDYELVYQLGAIRLNGTYMELADKFFAWKGVLTLIALIGGTMSFQMLSIQFVDGDSSVQPYSPDIFLVALFLIMLGFSVWVLLRESFTYTHYPIRLNRKTRMIHVFRQNGTVLSTPWDEVFFCIAPVTGGFWEIQGHVLDADGKTVRESFAFSYYTSKSGMNILKGYWELIRRYMEEGPEGPARSIEIFLPIADRKETFLDGFHRMHAEWGVNIVTALIGALVAGVLAPGRWIAMQTSKLPVWPTEIEDACCIEPGDPYVRDARSNPADLR
ncbi:DUF6708 domain-containing protein [Nitrogeniibacter aestuarii]|uniref:DUF6708 domain-containing protein n=1 Tax=Nitrogeniibacter aestuarii TaxID=2815343 RepID=UPI001D0FEAD9|nr:DUF6708 domain-containing protein [Nitrogeniibacter aestuarii]